MACDDDPGARFFRVKAKGGSGSHLYHLAQAEDAEKSICKKCSPPMSMDGSINKANRKRFDGTFTKPPGRWCKICRGIAERINTGKEGGFSCPVCGDRWAPRSGSRMEFMEEHRQRHRTNIPSWAFWEGESR